MVNCPTISITDEWGIFLFFISHQRKHGGSVSKESACNAGDLGLIPGLGRAPGGGHGNPLQYSCLENSMDEEPGGLLTVGLQRVEHIEAI